MKDNAPHDSGNPAAFLGRTLRSSEQRRDVLERGAALLIERESLEEGDLERLVHPATPAAAA